MEFGKTRKSIKELSLLFPGCLWPEFFWRTLGYKRNDWKSEDKVWFWKSQRLSKKPRKTDTCMHTCTWVHAYEWACKYVSSEKELEVKAIRLGKTRGHSLNDCEDLYERHLSNGLLSITSFRISGVAFLSGFWEHRPQSSSVEKSDNWLELGSPNLDSFSYEHFRVL